MNDRQRLRGCENVLFDIDGTLLDFEASKEIALSHLCRRWEIGSVPRAVEAFDAVSGELWRQFECGNISLCELFSKRFSHFCRMLRIEDDGAQMERFFQEALCNEVVVYEDTAQCLASISRRYRVYAVTNGNTDTQLRRLEAAGLTAWLNGILTSEEAGVQKPDRRFFQAYFKRFPECLPERALIVGDSESSDVEGGRRAGVLTCLCDRGGSQAGGDFYITSLRELTEMLEVDGV